MEDIHCTHFLLFPYDKIFKTNNIKAVKGFSCCLSE